MGHVSKHIRVDVKRSPSGAVYYRAIPLNTNSESYMPDEEAEDLLEQRLRLNEMLRKGVELAANMGITDPYEVASLMAAHDTSINIDELAVEIETAIAEGERIKAREQARRQ